MFEELNKRIKEVQEKLYRLQKVDSMLGDLRKDGEWTEKYHNKFKIGQGRNWEWLHL